VLGGRNRDKLNKAASAVAHKKIQVFELTDKAELERFIGDCAAVVNCAGPFGETARTIAEAAIAAGVSYLDTTGQPPVVEDLQRLHETARGADIVIAPAMGFFGALADLMARAACEPWLQADEITVAYALGDWVQTLGSRATLLAMGGKRQVFASGHHQVKTGQPPIVDWTFPEPVGRVAMMPEYPSPEVISIPRQICVTNLNILMTLKTVQGLRERASRQMEPGERPGTSFTVIVRASGPAWQHSYIASGDDIYDITAPIVGEAVQRILERKVHARGVVAAGETFDVESFLAALAPAGLRLMRMT
jgi:short subunit dehydrogenase-like uncharacterized protein